MSAEAGPAPEDAPLASPLEAPPNAAPAAPARPGRTRGALLLESALIVFSVLLGFALSEWREHVRERALARDVIANTRLEIGENLETLRRMRPTHIEMARRLRAAADRDTAGTAFDAFYAAFPEGGIGMSLRDAAWQTAVSTGALRLLDYEDAALLSATYDVQRTTLVSTQQRISDRFLSPQNFDPAMRRAMVLTHHMLLVELTGQEGHLIEVYQRALRELP